MAACRRQYPLSITIVSSRPSAKGAWQATAPASDLNLLRDLQGIIDLYAQVPHRRLKFGVAEQGLNGSQVLRAFVDRWRVRTPGFHASRRVPAG